VDRPMRSVGMSRRESDALVVTAECVGALLPGPKASPIFVAVAPIYQRKDLYCLPHPVRLDT